MELSMLQLLQASLGSRELNSENVKIVHTVMNGILAKLDCEADVVSFTGINCIELRELLDASKPCSLASDLSCIVPISYQFERLDSLGVILEKNEEKHQCHLDWIEKYTNFKIPPVRITNEFFTDYDNICPPVYVFAEEDEMGFGLLNSNEFLQKLSRRTIFPIVDAVFRLEQSVEKLFEQLEIVSERVKEDLKKISLLEKWIDDLSSLKDDIEQRHSRFLCAMEAVQDLLDMQMDSFVIPAFKMDISSDIKAINDLILSLQIKEGCPHVPSYIRDIIICITCCARVTMITIATDATDFQSWKEPKLPITRRVPENQLSISICRVDERESEADILHEIEQELKEDPLKVTVVHLEFSKVKIKHSLIVRQATNPCIKISDKTDAKYITGTDGAQYRKQPD